MNFGNLQWGADRLTIGDWVFRLEYNRDDDSWEFGSNCFPLIKSKILMDSYADFFGSRTGSGFTASNIVEVGMFSGGSMALWNEIFQPEKLVGIDIQSCQENDYFRRYVQSCAGERLTAYWETDQADKEKLGRICSDTMNDGIDLVFDDASHLYSPTRSCFETLFPRLRPGGLYIIEDWNWAHTAAFQQETSIWRDEPALTQLICELVEAAGSSPWVASVHICNGFTAVERGRVPFDQETGFSLAQIISRRPWTVLAEEAAPSR